MNKDAFLMAFEPKIRLDEDRWDEIKWDKIARYGAQKLLYEQVMQVNHKKEESDMVMKFDKCITCAHRDNAWRCAVCINGEMYVPVGHTIKAEYHTIGRRNGKTKEAKEHLKMYYGVYTVPQIKDVIFNGPATIVFWEDGTKTVVKVMEGYEFDPHTGLAEAIAKKALGDDYRKTFRKYIKKYDKQKEKEANAQCLACLLEATIDILTNHRRKRDDS